MSISKDRTYTPVRAAGSKSHAYRIFLSHDKLDYATARLIRSVLERPGITVFMFEHDIPGGNPFPEAIRDELERSNELCLLWTQNSMSSTWVLFEIAGAYALKRHIAPFLADGMAPEQLPEAIRGHECRTMAQLSNYAEEVARRAGTCEPDFQQPRSILDGNSEGDWQVIAHCDSAKWQTAGFPHAPGNRLYSALSSYGPYVDLQMLGNFGSDLDESAVSLRLLHYSAAIFLLDSPRSNPLVRRVLDTYRRWVSMGGICFELRTDPQSGFEYEHVVVQGVRTFRSDKYLKASTRQCLVGPYRDYFVVLRLPGAILGMTRSDAKLWVICGIHAKGTWTAVQLFERKNLHWFVEAITSASPGRKIPEYFEAVFEVPDSLRADDEMDLRSLGQVHFAELLCRDQEMVTDSMDVHLLPLFRRDKCSEIPIQIAHVDPVAGCNYNCPGCIESNLRNMKAYLSLSRCVDILAYLRGCGCKKIGFYGGEPTLHPDFGCLLRAACAMSFDVAVVTNGSQLHQSALRRAIVDCMQSSSPPRFRISVDADTDTTHARVHGVPVLSELTNIKTAAVRLIDDHGVSVSISYRLVPESVLGRNKGNVFEAADSCRFWKGRARQFSLRPMTTVEGKSPTPFSDEELRAIAEIRQNPDFAGFVSVPDWLSIEPEVPHAQKKAYDVCYSAFYRIAISPYIRVASSHLADSAMSRLSGFCETNDAWLSLCTYERLSQQYGVLLPRDLASWMRSERPNDIGRIDPRRDCCDVLCCRHSYNES